MPKLSPPLLAQALRDRAYKDGGLSSYTATYLLQAADQIDSLYNQLHPRVPAEVVRTRHTEQRR